MAKDYYYQDVQGKFSASASGGHWIFGEDGERCMYNNLKQAYIHTKSNFNTNFTLLHTIELLQGCFKAKTPVKTPEMTQNGTFTLDITRTYH